jgi:hypothetical protein
VACDILIWLLDFWSTQIKNIRYNVPAKFAVKWFQEVQWIEKQIEIWNINGGRWQQTYNEDNILFSFVSVSIFTMNRLYCHQSVYLLQMQTTSSAVMVRVLTSSAVMVRVLTSSAVMGLNPGLVKPKTIKLVFVASR